MSRTHTQLRLELDKPRGFTPASLRRAGGMHTVTITPFGVVDVCAALGIDVEEARTLVARSPDVRKYQRLALLAVVDE